MTPPLFRSRRAALVFVFVFPMFVALLCAALIFAGRG